MRAAPILIGTAALALAGCASGTGPTGNLISGGPASPMSTVTTVLPVTLPMAERVADVPGGGYHDGGHVSTFCDHGNRVYVFDAEQRAGIAAVPDRTCPGGAP